MPKQSYYLGETIQHELKCATIGFMFITIIRHIKSLQKKQMHHTSTKLLHKLFQFSKKAKESYAVIIALFLF